jgi:hypothetical protein
MRLACWVASLARPDGPSFGVYGLMQMDRVGQIWTPIWLGLLEMSLRVHITCYPQHGLFKWWSKHTT